MQDEGKTKRKRKTPDTDSPVDEDEKLEQPFSKDSLESSEGDYSASPHLHPFEGYADELDSTELSY